MSLRAFYFRHYLFTVHISLNYVKDEFELHAMQNGKDAPS